MTESISTFKIKKNYKLLQKNQFLISYKMQREGTNFPSLMLGMGYVGHRLFCNITIQN